MDFSIPGEVAHDIESFKDFLKLHLAPNLAAWNRQGAVPRSFFTALGDEGWFGFAMRDGRMVKFPALRRQALAEQMAVMSPGVGIAALVHEDLGMIGLHLYGSEEIQRRYAAAAVRGETLLCLGNTEGVAGSDVAAIAMSARKASGGWILNGIKPYVTNGLISDYAIITAVSAPEADRSRRLSMFLVDLTAVGVQRKKLNKQVWIPSDLTRIQLDDVFVPEGHLLGEEGHGLRQVLAIFTHSRIPISALTLGTAVGAFEMGIDHAARRKAFGKRLIEFQAKSFEIADFHARIEAARLMLYKACVTQDAGADFRMESSLAKYLAVEIARETATWAADLFGAASVIREHPIHKFPMDAWGSSLGEGTQDIQKLVIFRELMKRRGID
jgi:alkylation response protein AidB-like acyl-CoA dehydrogenase